MSSVTRIRILAPYWLLSSAAREHRAGLPGASLMGSASYVEGQVLRRRGCDVAQAADVGAAPRDLAVRNVGSPPVLTSSHVRLQAGTEPSQQL